MKFRILAIWFLLLPALALHAQERDAFTFTSYKLAVNIHPQEQAIEVRGFVTLRNDSEKAQEKAFLQISSPLRWATVRAGNKTLPFVQKEIRSDIDHTGSVNEAQVSLPSAVQPGESIDLEVGYRGRILLNAQRLERLGTPGAMAAHTDYDVISAKFTLLRGVGHVLWFPAALEPATFDQENRVFSEAERWRVRHAASQMSLSLTLDNDAQTIISNADQQNKSEDFHWSRFGLAGPVLVIGDYTIEPGPMALAYLPAHQAAATDYANVIKQFDPPLTGPQKHTPMLVDLPDREDESFDGGQIFLLPLKTIERRSLELTLAYLWAQATIVSPRPWIAKGVAHYAQALMREHQEGRKAALEFLSQKKPGLGLAEPDFSSPEAGKSRAGESLINATQEIYYRTKAMYVWWMLRDLIGEGAISNALLHYKPEEDKSAAYMQKLLQAESHKDLEWFFDDWVYRDRGLPELRINNVYARESLRGAYLVTATIENSGAAAAEVPVIVSTASGNVNSRLHVPGHGIAVARIETGDKPLTITVNDGSVPEVDLSDNTAAIKLPEN